jgi:putative protease
MNTNIPQLVLPGGDLHKVEIAFKYGADAVYVGLDKYSLRKGEIRFSIPEIGEAVKLAHSLGKKLYVTFNIFAHNDDFKDIEKDMTEIAALSPDAFIISDPGIIATSKRIAPQVPIHLSTQANTVNAASVGFWESQGIKRVVLGREVKLAEMAEIKKANPKMEIEVFAHGAMCISYSGRCLLSSFMTGRSANLGACAQPCRWGYKVYLEEQKNREGELFEMTEDERGTYIMSSKDLCTIE